MKRTYNNKRVFITGGLGFLGSNLAHRLVDLGAKVTVLDCFLPHHGGNLYNLAGISKRVKVIKKDIRAKGLARHLKGQQFVFHFAGHTSHVDSMKDPYYDIDINCRGNAVFLEALRAGCPKARIIYCGTRAQYGRLDYQRVDEKHTFKPVDVYGASKATGEMLFFVYHRAYGMRVSSLRLTNAYGPRHQMKNAKFGIFNWFMRLAMDDAVLPIYGKGEQTRDFVYVDDVVRAFLLLGAKEKTVGEAYNIGCGKAITFRRMVELVQKAAGGKIQFRAWPKERKQIECGDFLANYKKLAAATGWQPKMPLEEGIRRTVEYYRANKKHYWK
jgi:UDP-glucose 4-epimerase